MRPRTLLAAIGAMVVAAAVVLALRGSSALGPVDGHDLPAVDTGRVAVGDTAPDFALEAFRGGRVALTDFRGERDIVLVFYRGRWWPWCVRQLGELERLLTPEQSESTKILAVSIDPFDETELLFDRLEEEHGERPGYTFLSDPGHRVIDRYGLRNPDKESGIPHPTVFVIDRDGVVRWKFIETNYKIRPTNEMLLDALAGLPRR